MTRRTAVAALLGLLCSVALADYVRLKNGNRIQGTIVEDSPTQVVIRTGNGKLTFPRRMIKEVVHEAAPEPAPDAQPVPRRQPTPPPPKPAPGEPATAGGQAPFGGALEDNFWARMRARGVNDGDRFEFTLRFHTLPLEKRKGESFAAQAGGYTIELVGKEFKTVPAPYATAFTVTVGSLRLDPECALSWRWSGKDFKDRTTQIDFRSDKFPAPRGEQTTLEFAGRSFPCRIEEQTLDSGIKTRTWFHVDGRRRAVPMILRREWDGVVVQELTAIRAAEDPGRLAPRDPGVRVGDRWTVHERPPGGGELIERVYTVTDVCPNTIRGRDARGNVGGWLYNGQIRERYKTYALHKEESLTLAGGTSILTMFHEGGPQRQWWRMWPDGRDRFPGLVRGELQRKLYLELVEVEEAGPR